MRADTLEDRPDLRVMAELSVNLGRVATALEDQQAKWQRQRQAIRPIPGIVVPQITTTNGVADFPELCSPRMGYWWDVHAITVNTFSAGSVLVYLSGGGSGGGNSGALADSNLRFTFAAKGQQSFGKAQFMIPPQMRVIFSASGITGNASPTLYVTEIAAWAMSDYLL